MLKILQASLQQYMKHDILDLEKAEERLYFQGSFL